MHQSLQFKLWHPARRGRPLAGLLLATLWATGCGETMPRYLEPLPPTDDDPAGSVGATTGLPCDVSQVLQTHCLRCHGNPPAGAPITLASYQALNASSMVDSTKRVAERALLRMQDSASPMPPGAGPTVGAAEVDVVRTWVTAGMPAGTCNGNPADPPLHCTSGQMWTGGDSRSPLMHPGGTCLVCHAGAGPQVANFQFAGTVFPSSHEPTDCQGSDGMTLAMTVEITDAAGKVFVIPINASGNFMYAPKRGKLKLPYHAKVRQGGTERAMTATQMSGDCNGCHTPTGANGAPGRIVAP